MAGISAIDYTSSSAALEDHVTPAPLGQAGATAVAANEASKEESPAVLSAPTLEGPPPPEPVARKKQPSDVDTNSKFSAEPLASVDVVLPSSEPATDAPEQEKEMAGPSTPWAFAPTAAEKEKARAGGSTVRRLQG